MASLPLPLTDPGRRVLTVSELTHAVKDTLEGRFGGLWVEGEVSNLRVHTSGHVYFTLKDEEAQVRAVLFRSGVRRVPTRVRGAGAEGAGRAPARLRAAEGPARRRGALRARAEAPAARPP